MSLQHVSSLLRSRGYCLVRENCRGRSFAVIVLGVMGALSICACTSGSIYEDRRQDARRACLNKPTGIQRDECLDRNSQSYDEYTRERERVHEKRSDQVGRPTAGRRLVCVRMPGRHFELELSES